MAQGMMRSDRSERDAAIDGDAVVEDGATIEGVVDISELTVEDFHEFVAEGAGGDRDVSVHRRGAAAYLVAR